MTVRPMNERERRSTDDFHRVYYSNHEQTWKNTRWLGVPISKMPFDCWVYQEQIVRLRPDLLVETGTAAGGSALFYATVMDAIGHGRVLTIDSDLHCASGPHHPRIEYLVGRPSTDPDVLAYVQRATRDLKTVLVSLDSFHWMPYVLEEIQAYARFVTVGSLLVVEDTNLDGAIQRRPSGGPTEAVRTFLRQTKDFQVETECHKFYLSFYEGGWLRRVA